MKAAQFEYVRPTQLEQAISHLTESGQVVKVMGGSQSMGPMLNLRLVRPNRVVDISGIQAMREVTETSGAIKIGAAITHAEIEDGVFAPLRGHLMQEVAGRIAYRGVRNRGTLAGSLAHADPAADWVVVMSALGARIHVLGANGPREVVMPDFMLGAYTTDLHVDEIIVAVTVPARSVHTSWGYYKFCRKTGEFAEASCAAWFDRQAQSARIAVGALDGAPVLLDAWAAEVARKGWAGVDEVGLHAQIDQIAPHASQAKKHMLSTAVQRCLVQVLGAKNA